MGTANALHTHGTGTDGGSDAKTARHAQGGLLAVQGPTVLDIRTGVLVGPGSTALVTGTSDTGPMTVSIAPHVPVSSRGTANGPYLGPALEAATKVNIAAAPGAGAGDRIDIVYFKQQDKTAGVPTPDGVYAPLYGVKLGTPGLGKPDLSTIVGAVEVGTVTVSPGATATNGANVVIANTARQTTTRGGVIPVKDQAERVALQTAGMVYPTMQVLELDKGRRLWHDGTRFRYEGDRVLVTGTADRDTLTAYSGLTAYDATGARWLHNGTAWLAGRARASLYQAAAQSGLTSGTFVTITLDAETVDTHAGHTAGGPGFTVPAGQGGSWLVDGGVSLPSLTAGLTASCRVLVNGATVPNGNGQYGPLTSASGSLVVLGAKLLTLAAGDVVTLQGNCGTTWGTNAAAGAASWLTLVRQED